MQEEKSWVYTLILGICMLLCLLLIGRMLVGETARQSESETVPEHNEQEETQMGIRIEEQALAALISQALPFQPEQITIKIDEDQTIALTAAVRKADLSNSGLVPGHMRTALLFLPDQCKIYACWTASATDGVVTLRCREAEIAGFGLTEEITTPLTEQLSNIINRVLKQQQIAPEAIEWEDGQLILLP